MKAAVTKKAVIASIGLMNRFFRSALEGIFVD